jgi:hypothetical protein
MANIVSEKRAGSITGGCRLGRGLRGRNVVKSIFLDRMEGSRYISLLRLF